MPWIAQLQVLGQVAVAAVLGGLIGLERELADKPAGFRTHMIVAGTSALLVGLSLAFVQVFQSSGDSRIDPTRTVQAIVTGISFLGAGTIIRRGDTDRIEGLTTAASLLLAGAIGISIGLHQYVIGVGATLLALVVLTLMKYVERWIVHFRARP